MNDRQNMPSQQVLDETCRLVEEAAALLGVPGPEVLESDSPSLTSDALRVSADDAFYLIGIIGGKNVGKSALVNALVGQEITLRTSVGVGTDRVIAYAHEGQVDRLRELLEREAPGRYEIITHRETHLARQVLLDLPDFDSRFTEHLELTRRMLRHMLYPIWIQSVEKYADAQPRELLRRVAAGNAPENFVFCLNKVDYLVEREGPEAACEIRDDYARRIASALQIPTPRVWMISAIHPDRYDLPALREQLACEKSVEIVRSARDRATGRQVGSLLGWFERQGVVQELERLRRLEVAAQEEVAARLAGPVIEEVLPRIVADPDLRWSLAEDVLQRRAARWPIVNAIHLLLDPMLAAIRGRLTGQSGRVRSEAASLVATQLGRLAHPLPRAVQGTFAQLQQHSPAVSRLYESRKLWESSVAEQAVRQLQTELVTQLEQIAAGMRDRLGGGAGVPGAVGRFCLTIGAVIWFALLQPVLAAYLEHGSFSEATVLVVRLLGVEALLRTAGFLAVYFLIVWAILRWRVRRRVDRAIARWHAGGESHLARVVLEWALSLLDPLRARREQLARLVENAQRIRQLAA